MYNFLKHYNIEKIREFLETRNKKVLVFDSDCDGLCSAVLVSKIFPGFEILPKRGPRISPEFLQVLIRTKAELFVFMDMAVDHERESLKKLMKELPEARILIIDHHIPERNLNSGNIIHVNPVLFRDVYQPASYVSYKLMERFDKAIKGFAWVSAMGCVADYAAKDVADLYRECRKAYPGLIGKNPQKSRIKKGVEMLEAIILIKGLEGARKGFNFLLNSDKYKDLIGIKELDKYLEKAKKEFNKALNQAERGKEDIKASNLVIFEIRTKYGLASAISTYFSERYPDKTIIVRKKSKDIWKLSVRNQSGKVNVGEIVKKCAKGIGSGGGHKRAAGAQIKEWGKFRERFVSELIT